MSDMKEPIIIIKSTRYRSPALMDSWQKKFRNQLVREGLIVLPNDFEFTIINADDSGCQIEVRDIDWNEPKEVKKEGGFFQKLFKRKKEAQSLVFRHIKE